MNRTLLGKYDRPKLVFFQDEVVSTLASLLSVLVLRWIISPIYRFGFWAMVWIGIAAVAMAAGILVTGSHRIVVSYTTVRSTSKVLAAVLVKEVILTVALLFVPDGVLTRPIFALTILVDFIVTFGGLMFLRLGYHIYGPESKEQVMAKAASRTALVSGTGNPSLELARTLTDEGWVVLGLLTDNPNMEGRVIQDYVVYFFRDTDDLNHIQWKLGGIDGIFYARTELHNDKKKEADIIPPKDGMTRGEKKVKRTFDVTLSAILLVIFSPLIGICAAAIRLGDGRPVIYSQERIGKDGKPFKIYKFRSMKIDAEAEDEPILADGEEDPRLTKAGRFLRAHHLDELPQLWNVLKGDMSFVGYRPEREYFINLIMKYNARYRYLYQIKPGVTSYATLYNGYTYNIDKMLTRLDLDLYYLRNRSIWFDIKVLGLTFMSIVSGKKF